MKKLWVEGLFLLALGTAPLQASDVGPFYWIFKRAEFTQTSTANPVPAAAPFHFTSLVERATGGQFMTGSTFTPPGSGAVNTPQFYAIIADGSLQYDVFTSSQVNLDNAFGSGGYVLNLNGAQADYTATLSLSGNQYPAEIPKLTNTNFKNGQLVVNPATAFALSWNSFADHDFVDDVIVLSITNGTATVMRSVLNPATTSKAFAANFLKPEQNYVVDLTFVRVSDKEVASIAGSTGLAGFGRSTRIFISTSSRTPISGLGNISTRGSVGTGDNVLISGFIVTSSDATKLKVVIRALGPSLSAAGITNPLQDPTIELYDGQNHLIATNNNWRNTLSAGQIAAFHLAPIDDRESALIRDLSPGSYTAVVRGKNGTTGVGLTEVYNLGSSGQAKLANISTRGQVLTGDQVMIGGLIIQGPLNHTVLFRALGPSLSRQGVSGVLANPTLQIVNAQGQNVSFNDNWKSTQQAQIQATGIPPTNDQESAILRTFIAGGYTAIVRGQNQTTGVALVEAYALD